MWDLPSEFRVQASRADRLHFFRRMMPSEGTAALALLGEAARAGTGFQRPLDLRGPEAPWCGLGRQRA